MSVSSRQILLGAFLLDLCLLGVARAQDATFDMKALLAAPAKPINLKITTSSEGAVTKTIDEAGGTVEISTPNGAKFTLEIPKDALAGPVEITLAPIASIAGVPPRSGVYGIDMQPSGLTFRQPATLSVRLPAVEDGNQMLSFGYDRAGEDVYLHPFVARDGRLVRAVHHFSGSKYAALNWGGLDCELFGHLYPTLCGPPPPETDGRDPSSPPRRPLRDPRQLKDAANAAGDKIKRAAQKIATILAEESKCQRAGGNCDGQGLSKICGIHRSVGRDYYNATFDELMSPDMTCAKARQTVGDNLAIERGSQLLGCTDDKTTLFTETRSVRVNGQRQDLTMMQLALRVCDKEAEDLCTKSGEVADLVQKTLGTERQRQLLGQGSDEGTVELVKKMQACAAFEVTIDNRSKEHHIDVVGCTVDVTAKVTLKAEMGLSDPMDPIARGQGTHKLDDHTVLLRCEAGDAYRMVGWRTETPPAISLAFDVRNVPSRTPGETKAEIFNYYLLVDPGSITKDMEAKASRYPWTAFPWGAWFNEEFLVAYQRKAVRGGIKFKVPMTGEHPVVAKTIDQGRGDYVSPGQVKSQVVIDSTLTIRHVPPKIRNGKWEISDPRN